MTRDTKEADVKDVKSETPKEPIQPPKPKPQMKVGAKVEFALPEHFQTESQKTSKGVVIGIEKDITVKIDGKPKVTIRIRGPDTNGTDRIFHREPSHIKVIG